MKQPSIAAKILLMPLSKLYGAVTWTRNKLFDLGALKQREFDVPVISVGNIAVGGTGKTPHTEYIVDALSDHYHIGVLSRGYKRATKGFVLATPHTTPREIGDESYQLYQKFGSKVMVAVCESRVKGIETMLEIDKDINLIVLDDAFQHRYVKPKVAVVLTEYNRPIYEDHLMPYGHLRESMSSLNRADIVVVTKCPANLRPLDYKLSDKYLDLFPSQTRFFSTFSYGPLVPLFPKNAKSVPSLESLTNADQLLAVSGIANPRPFVRHIKSFAPRVKVNVFADHHEYTRKDMDLLVSRFNSMKSARRYIITTEKDAMRLMTCPYFPHELKPYIFYQPVRVDFIRRDTDKSDFIEELERRLKLKPL